MIFRSIDDFCRFVGIYLEQAILYSATIASDDLIGVVS